MTDDDTQPTLDTLINKAISQVGFNLLKRGNRPVLAERFVEMVKTQLLVLGVVEITAATEKRILEIATDNHPVVRVVPRDERVLRANH